MKGIKSDFPSEQIQPTSIKFFAKASGKLKNAFGNPDCTYAKLFKARGLKYNQRSD